MKNGVVFGKQAVLRPRGYSVVLLKEGYFLHPVSFFSFESDQFVPEVSMVSLSIVLNGLNTSKHAVFKKYPMTFKERLKANISLVIIKSRQKTSVGCKTDILR